MNNVRFYLKPFIAISVMNFFFLFIFGTYFDSYEGIINSALQSIYSAPITNWWDSNIHFILLYFYEKIILIFPEYNVYGIILICYNIFSLTILGLVFFRIYTVNLKRNDYFLLILCYSLVSFDTILMINSTKIAFILISTVIAFIESSRIEQKKISLSSGCICMGLIFFSCLIRFEAVFLFSAIYIILLIIYKRFVLNALIPFIVSSIFILVFQFLIHSFSSEAKQVFTYKEKEILIRENIDYSKLTEIQSIEVKALKDYYIADEVHYRLSFYDSISKYKSRNSILNLFDGFRISYFLNTLNKSLTDIKSSWYFILLFIITSLLLLLKVKIIRRKILTHILFLLLIPILLCFHSVLPLRFIVPFFAFATCLNIFILLYYNKSAHSIFLIGIVFLLIILYYSINTTKKYKAGEEKFMQLTTKLNNLNNIQPTHAPIIIYLNFPNNYFPVKPTLKIQKQNALFLNFYLFSSDEQYVKSWSKACSCNSLSLKQKIDYMVLNQNLFLVDENTLSFIQKYMINKYDIKINKINIGNFDNNLIICKLNYFL